MSILNQPILNIDVSDMDWAQYGVVDSVADGVATVDGLRDCVAG